MLQVDLETGKRKSWVETEEKEIIDLCGETPGSTSRVLLKETQYYTGN